MGGPPKHVPCGRLDGNTLVHVSNRAELSLDRTEAAGLSPSVLAPNWPFGTARNSGARIDAGAAEKSIRYIP